jgi:hypothetical protein
MKKIEREVSILFGFFILSVNADLVYRFLEIKVGCRLAKDIFS